MSVRVPVVEDEKDLVNLLRGYLEREGFEVRKALDGVAAVEAARVLNPEVVVLGWMLPGLDGMAIMLRELRHFSEAYVVLLTARSEEVGKIVVLSTGADDCPTKTSSPGEPVARIRAMLRRGDPDHPDVPPPPRLGDLTVDPGSRESRPGGEAVNLTALEFDLLPVLASRPRLVLCRFDPHL